MTGFSLLQWNIWYKQPIEPVIAEVKRWNPDVVCIQEYIRLGEYDSAQALADGLGFNMVRFPAQHWSDSETKEEQGNAILSRFPVLSHRSVFIQDERQKPMDGSDEGRVYGEAVIDCEGTELTIGTSHLSYSPQFAITEKRAVETEKLMTELKKHSKRFIFAADCNATPDSTIVKQICEQLHHVGPDFAEPTWPTKPFDYHGWQENELRWRIDYVLATPDLKVKTAEIPPTAVSDHLPILARFSTET